MDLCVLEAAREIHVDGLGLGVEIVAISPVFVNAPVFSGKPRRQ